MNEFELSIEPHDVVHENVVVPVLDGSSLIDWLQVEDEDDEPAFSGVRKDDLDAKPFQPGKAQLVLGCTCGIASCGPLVADITADENTVVWRHFRRPHRNGRVYEGFGPFTFDRKRYDEALKKLAELG
ncbi:hypothetical protein JNUCC0626_38635 [Lentzea sp. JNUCC 0626]|uniref:hypothetical protein n=1 Tax=Lentzea sp. JNUCC 0626 TaxID=3367513 RepID=UPI003747D3B1